MEKRIFTFNEAAHSYTDDRNFAYTSVTTIVGKYIRPFDSKAHARRLSKQGRGQYAGKSEKEILQMWGTITNTALDRGNERHNYIEDGVKVASGFKDNWESVKRPVGQMYTLHDILSDHNYGEIDIEKLREKIGNKYPKIWEAITYYVERGYRVYSEIVVYDINFLISGMIDLLFVNHDTKRFVIMDWKTNKHDIVFECGYYKKDDDRQQTSNWVVKAEYMLAPLDNLAECNGNHYAMQLSTYARMVENFGYTCEYIILTHIRDQFQLNKYGRPYIDKNGMFVSVPDAEERVQFYPITYYRDNVDAMFDHHQKKINGEFGIQYRIF